MSEQRSYDLSEILLEEAQAKNDWLRKRNAELELLVDDLTAAISNPQQWKGGYLSRMSLQGYRIKWYGLCNPLRQRARKALEKIK